MSEFNVNPQPSGQSKQNGTSDAASSHEENQKKTANVAVAYVILVVLHLYVFLRAGVNIPFLMWVDLLAPIGLIAYAYKKKDNNQTLEIISVIVSGVALSIFAVWLSQKGGIAYWFVPEFLEPVMELGYVLGPVLLLASVYGLNLKGISKVTSWLSILYLLALVSVLAGSSSKHDTGSPTMDKALTYLDQSAVAGKEILKNPGATELKFDDKGTGREKAKAFATKYKCWQSEFSNAFSELVLNYEHTKKQRRQMATCSKCLESLEALGNYKSTLKDYAQLFEADLGYLVNVHQSESISIAHEILRKYAEEEPADKVPPVVPKVEEKPKVQQKPKEATPPPPPPAKKEEEPKSAKDFYKKKTG